MNASDGLNLRDIHLPAEPGWWPPAPGWWLLALMAVMLLIFLARYLLRAQRRRRRIQSAERELRSVLKRFPEPNVQRLAGLSELTRRLCRRYAPDQLGLRGAAWLEFLDEGSADRFFTDGHGRLMLGGAYQRSADPAAVEAVTEPLRRRLRQLAECADA